jgi:cytochrome b561
MGTHQTQAAQAYDARTIWFHWLTVLLVGGQWLGAHTIDWFPKGILRTDARSTHVVIGLLLAALIVGRLTWRATRGRRLPPTDRGVLRLAATTVHGLLYLLIVTIIGLGIVNFWTRGDSLFGLISVPKLALGGADLHRRVGRLHALAANLILMVAALHAAAAIWHQYWRRDGLLSRMIPVLPVLRR